jgi:hypothetical protein
MYEYIHPELDLQRPFVAVHVSDVYILLLLLLFGKLYLRTVFKRALLERQTSTQPTSQQQHNNSQQRSYTTSHVSLLMSIMEKTQKQWLLV